MALPVTGCLEDMAQAIGPDALYANIMLLCNNAAIAAQIAVKLSETA